VENTQRASSSQRAKAAALLVFVLAVFAFVVPLLVFPIQRFWLHGPALEARIRIEAEAGGRWRSPRSWTVEQTTFHYIVEMPDGSREHIALPERFPVGTDVEIAFTRGAITGTMFVTAVREVDGRPPNGSSVYSDRPPNYAFLRGRGCRFRVA
jgi:hypothetical protein